MDILLVDGNALGYTSYHAGVQSVLPNGMQTQAIEGFIRALSFRLMENPQFVPVILWDGRAQWRYDLHPAYKSGRLRTEKQLADRAAYNQQVPFLQRLLKHLGVLQLKAPQAEADDLAYHACRWWGAPENTLELFSSDTDWWQLLAPNIAWKSCRKNAPYVQFGTFCEQTGYHSPTAFIEGKALKGDSADDIEGIAGIGEKTAQSVLATYRGVVGFYAAVEQGSVTLSRKLLQVLASTEGRALWRRNLTLMDLSRAPAISPTDLQVLPGYANQEGLLRNADPLELSYVLRWANQLVERFGKQQGNQTELVRRLTALG